MTSSIMENACTETIGTERHLSLLQTKKVEQWHTFLLENPTALTTINPSAQVAWRYQVDTTFLLLETLNGHRTGFEGATVGQKTGCGRILSKPSGDIAIITIIQRMIHHPSR